MKNKNKSRSRILRNLQRPKSRIRRNLFPVLIALSIALVIGILLLPGGKSSAQSKQNNTDSVVSVSEISPEAQLQIQSLIDEKNSRTPVQQKIDSQLLYAAKMRRGESLTSAVQTLDVNVGADENGVVTVDISAEVSDKLLSILKKMGVKIESSWVAYHTLRAQVSLDQLEAVAALPQVRFIQPKQESTTNQFNRATKQLPAQPSFAV